MPLLFTVLILGSFLFPRATACADMQHDHTGRHFQPVVTPPSMPLVWGDINILHTTDSHGWLGGHARTTPPEPNYSGDLGMFSSFVTHMQEEAERRNVDLLLIDSGDLHDGNGITDGFPPGEVNGHEALQFFSHLPYDLLTIGNHELYKYEVAYDVYKYFAPRWGRRYLTSNVNITVRSDNGDVVSVPIGDRFAKFSTRLGRSVTAFGVLFDFSMNSVNTTVQHVADMVKEGWFKEAIADEPDLFLLAGHMPVNKDKWPVVFDAIRAVHPYTPILILGGHAHIRDCVQFDGRSMALASGRYMETIGWMSAKLDECGITGDISFSRRYLDANPVSYSFHTRKHGEDFDTPLGRMITAGIKELSARYNLTYRFGIAPQDYYQNRVPFPSAQSLLSLLGSHVLPVALSISNPRASLPKIILTNSGAMRYDLYHGPFTRNDQFVISPFTNSFQYLTNVSSAVANRLLDELNHSGLPARRRREEDLQTKTLVDSGDVTAMYKLWMQEQWERWNSEERDGLELTLGYVTKDACPGVGDDVPHSPLPHFPTPPFVGSPPPRVPPEANNIDVVFADFIREDVLLIVNLLNAGSRPNYTEGDIKQYSNLLIDEVLGVYAQVKWS